MNSVICIKEIPMEAVELMAKLGLTAPIVGDTYHVVGTEKVRGADWLILAEYPAQVIPYLGKILKHSFDPEYFGDIGEIESEIEAALKRKKPMVREFEHISDAALYFIMPTKAFKLFPIFIPDNYPA